MNVLFAFNAYRHLDSRQKALIRSREIQSSMALEEWIPLLAGVAKFDRLGDQLRKACGWSAIVSFPLALILFIIFDGGLSFLPWLAPVVLGTSWWRLRKIDIPPALDRFLLPWLALLKEDVVKGTPVELKLDFHGANVPQKTLSQSDMPRGFPKSPHSCKDTYFNDVWLSGSAPLADGNVLSWDISDFVRQRVKTRRNARGKTKSKTKYKVQRSFDVALTARIKDYRIGEVRSDAAFRTSVKHGDKRSSIRVRSSTTEQALAVAPQLAMLVETVSRAYSHLSAPEKKEIS